MARLRDRASEAAETRGVQMLHKLDAGRDRLNPLRGPLHDPVGRGAGRGLDQAVMQGTLRRDAGLTEPFSSPSGTAAGSGSVSKALTARSPFRRTARPGSPVTPERGRGK
jgi:hypothetical protein